MNTDEKSEVIIPAIMPFSAEELESQVAKVAPYVEYVQIDLMDGEFVPQASWPYEDGVFALNEIEILKKVISDNPGLKFEVDLMVEHSISLAPVLVDAGVHRVVFHQKSIHDPIEVADFKKEFPEIEVGLALHTDDDVDVLKEYEGVLSMVQVMGIEKVGYQKQEFTEKALEVIGKAHAIFPHLPVQVDGGVSLDTIAQISDVGAYRFVAGSAIFGSNNPQEAITHLEEKI